MKTFSALFALKTYITSVSKLSWMDSTFEESSWFLEAELIFIWFDSLILLVIQSMNPTIFSGVCKKSAMLIMTWVLKSARHLVEFGCQYLQMRNDFDMCSSPRKFKIILIISLHSKTKSFYSVGALASIMSFESGSWKSYS